jgi:hypothetical protein
MEQGVGLEGEKKDHRKPKVLSRKILEGRILDHSNTLEA